MNLLEKLIPTSVLYAFVGINYMLLLVGGALGSMDLILWSGVSIVCFIVGIIARKKQKNDTTDSE